MTQLTSPWLQFLARSGASLSEAAYPETTAFSVSGEGTNTVTPLLDLGLITVSGDDAASFLHSQLTNDVEGLNGSDARLAGYCSPKGRLLATMLIWKSADGVMLQLPRAILPALQKRLQMFVLRAKAKLTEMSDERVLLGISGEKSAAALAPWFSALPDAPYEKVDAPAGTLIRLPDAAGIPRYEWITDPDTAEQAWPRLTATLQPMPGSWWRLLQIRSGIPQITQATQEQFVPQMINFEAVGGVNFRKGCYPGQEIVARSQYLGKLKRRMLPATIEADDATEAAAGMEVFSVADPDQPCGMIVNAERSADGRVECLVEIKTAVLDEGQEVRLGSANGPVLHFTPLPYPLPDPA